MNYQRAVSVLLAVTAASMLVTGSFGFTSVSADRGVSVAVVEDENAYVGVSVCETDNGNGNGANPVKVTVTNQFAEPFTVVSISGDERSKHPNRKKGKIAPGDSETFNVFGDKEVTVTVDGGLDATVTAEVGDQCNSKGPNNANVNGTPTETATATSNGTETATPRPEPTGTPTATGDA